MYRFSQLIILIVFLTQSTLSAGIIFTDDFNTGASGQWADDYGDWSDGGGVYAATSTSAYPNSHSSLPFNLTDFTIEFDINNVADGGVWLRSAPNTSGTIGRTGILLVTGGGSTAGDGLYWHVVTSSTSYGSSLNTVRGLFTSGVSDPNIRVTVSGNSYSAFVNGATTAATTLVNNDFTSGQVALYDFSTQTFDNVSLSIADAAVPEPSSLILFSFCSLLFLGVASHRRTTSQS